MKQKKSEIFCCSKYLIYRKMQELIFLTYIKFSQFNGKFAVPLPRNQMIKSGCGAFLYMENRYHFLVRNLADGRSPNDYNISK